MATPDSTVPSPSQGEEEAARLAAEQQQRDADADVAAERLANAQAHREANPTAPMTVEEQFAQLRTEMAASNAQIAAAFTSLRGEVNQAGGIATNASRWAQQAGGATNSMATWIQQAAAATGQPAALPVPVNVKPPKPPKFKGGGKEPRILEWAHQAGTFLMSASLTETVQGVFHITNYLEGDAAVWWRLYCARVERKEAPAVLNWWALRLLMLEQFSEINRLSTVRDELANLRQKGSVASYITKFQTVILELPEKSEEDLVHQFLRGLSQGVQIMTRTHQPQTLSQAMRIADEADRAIQQSKSGSYGEVFTKLPSASDRGVSDSNGPVPMQLGAVMTEERQRLYEEGRCFNCEGFGHNASQCPSGDRRSGSQSSTPSRRQLYLERRCFKCYETGHNQYHCPNDNSINASEDARSHDSGEHSESD